MNHMKRKDNYPLISVIVPVYNGEKYLEYCANSILKQDYDNIELIIVDDGSKDASNMLAKKIAASDKRVTLINQKNSGVSVARNNGIKHARGKYVTFIDVDDYINEDYISYFYSLIKNNNAQIALTPQLRKFNNQTIDEIVEEIPEKIEVWSGQKTAQQMLYYNIVISPCNKIISMDLIRKNNLEYNTSLSFGEGFNFSLDCFQRADKVAVGRRKVYNYRVDNPNSVMTKISLKLITGSLEAQKCIRENLVNATPEMIKACQYANWHTCYDCLNTIVGSKSIKKYKKEYKMLKKICRKDSHLVIGAPISKINKLKGLMYFISPYLTARIINHFRIRKFTIEQ